MYALPDVPVDQPPPPNVTSEKHTVSNVEHCSVDIANVDGDKDSTVGEQAQMVKAKKKKEYF
jgi:hypothetical protein